MFLVAATPTIFELKVFEFRHLIVLKHLTVVFNANMNATPLYSKRHVHAISLINFKIMRYYVRKMNKNSLTSLPDLTILSTLQEDSVPH